MRGAWLSVAPSKTIVRLHKLPRAHANDLVAISASDLQAIIWGGYPRQCVCSVYKVLEVWKLMGSIGLMPLAIIRTIPG